MMQPRVTEIRNTLTAAQVEALIKTDASITIGFGMELLDRDLNVLSDVSDSLRECSTSRDNTVSIHGTCSFDIATPLPWGRAIVRPFTTIDNGTVKARFNQGAYFTSTPATKTDRLPRTYSVQGYDILTALNTLVGDSYAIGLGENYLTAVESILLANGYTQYSIDPIRAATTAPAAKGWPLDENTTWLQIVNELLKAVGYRPIYSDWHGRLICESLVNTPDMPPEWYYTRGQFDGQLVPESDIVHDFFATPNRWVGINGATNTTTSPTEGNGKYTYINANQGETSVNERGQTITKVMTVEAADQAALVAAVMAEVAKDKNVGTTMEARTSSNPLHWHEDVVSVDTLELGITRMQQVRWSLNLRTGEMAHGWAVV
jgi:hypothetical protein